jgi:hypothetical protein
MRAVIGFHTVALPLATALAIYWGVRMKAPLWKQGALVAGCGLMLVGLWTDSSTSTFVIIAGGTLFFMGIPRRPVEQRVGTDVASPAPEARASSSGGPSIRLTLPKPGFFLNDVRVKMLLDGAPVYDGSFTSGFDVTFPAAAGNHRLESVIELGIAQRRRQWDVVVPAAGCDVQVEYSRFWGNFTKSLLVTAK